MLMGQPVDTPLLTLCVGVTLLTFPGRNRFRLPPMQALIDLLTSWFVVLAALAVCAWATGSLALFDRDLLLAWTLTTPAVQAALTAGGHRWMAWQAAQPQRQRKALIVGAGPMARQVLDALRSRDMSGRRVLGCVDDRVNAKRLQFAPDLPRLGGLADLATTVRRLGVHEVFITLPLGSQPRITAVLQQLQATTASVYFVPDVFGTAIIQGRVQTLHGVPVVGLCETPFTGINHLVKRVCDLVLATLILLLIAPLLLLIALGVKLDSPGPVIFRQRRNGLDGEEIVVWKFRSMRALDDGPQIRQATRGDPRITRFGAFLRRTSLDELPQFFNVLQGRMSVVGPRPHAVAHNDQYRDLISAYMVRHKVKPGITGWAQVNGCRGETDSIDKMEARVAYDLDYLRNWSLTLDLQIIVRTLRLVLMDRHAY